jgi:hypothetical protein
MLISVQSGSESWDNKGSTSKEGGVRVDQTGAARAWSAVDSGGGRGCLRMAQSGLDGERMLTYVQSGPGDEKDAAQVGELLWIGGCSSSWGATVDRRMQLKLGSCCGSEDAAQVGELLWGFTACVFFNTDLHAGLCPGQLKTVFKNTDRK